MGVSRRGLVLAALLVGMGPTAVHADEVRPARSVQQLTDRLCALLADPSPEAAQALRQRVARGVPPGALLVLLERFRADPRAELVDVIRELAQYRRPEVRARALAAWAALGGYQAELAIDQASRDVAPRIRWLAVALARVHPSPNTDERIAALLRRDPELAARVAPQVAGVPGAPS